MLTALTIESVKTGKWYKKVFNKLRGNSIITEIKSARGVALRDIRYINRNGVVDWYALDSVIGAQRNHILCNDSVIFPENMGFKRFENTEFKRRLACNLGLFVLSKIKSEIPDLKVGVYDGGTDCSPLISELVNYCGNIQLVTDNPEQYDDMAETVLSDTGIVVNVSENRETLSDCPLIIAPARIDESLPVSGSSIVLTAFAPTVCVTGLVYFDYYFRMPNMFDRIKPESLRNEYFAGALYTKGRQYELGSIVPTTCSNYSSSQTPKSICEYLVRLKN